MRRIHLFALEDQDWLPRPVRDAGTDWLRFMSEVGNVYGCIVPKLRDALAGTGSQEILDLCSGGAGPVLAIQKQLAESGCHVRVLLTDKYPNRAAFRYAQERSGGTVNFVEEPVDATEAPPLLKGFRTLFASLHHLRPELARMVLQDAVDRRCPIAVFDMTARTLPPLPMLLLGNPLMMLVLTPVLRPFRWSRLLWTYLLPVVPLFVMWDALVSGLRLYSLPELQELVDGIRSDGYHWEMGRYGFPRSITYLIGRPEAVAE